MKSAPEKLKKLSQRRIWEIGIFLQVSNFECKWNANSATYFYIDSAHIC